MSTDRPRRPEAQAIDVDSLLTIDVESELRKLTQAQLQGPWQLPAELVRRALREGASEVEVELGRGVLRVRSRGGAVGPSVLRELAALLDPQRSPERRHRALARLEGHGALSLLGLVGLEPTSLRVHSSGPGTGTGTETETGSGPGTDSEPGTGSGGLEWKRGGAPSFQRGGGDWTEVVVRGAKLDRARAREWLASVCRHAPVPIRVDGRALVGGFEDALFVCPVAGPLPGQLAIPREGEVGRIYLLQDGLLSTHLSITEGPCFELALETCDLPGLGRRASAADLRDAVEARRAQIVGAAVDAMVELVRGGRAMSTRDRSRLTELLLQAARRDRARAKAIARLPLFRSLETDGRERWADLLGLRQTVQEEGEERWLCALFPDQDPAEFSPQGRVYILGEVERGLLGELLDLGFRQPRRAVQGRRGGFGRARVRDLIGVLRPGGRPIPDAVLDADEQQLLIQLRAHLDRCELTMCSGAGPVRRFGRGPDRLRLPRESSLVRAAVVAVRRDPSWVYPTLLALLGGRDFPERARRRWRFESWG